jgi:hypothetical protein
MNTDHNDLEEAGKPATDLDVSTGDRRSPSPPDPTHGDDVNTALACMKEKRESLGDDHVETLAAINAAAVKLEEAQRYAEAVDLFAEAATRRQKVYSAVIRCCVFAHCQYKLVNDTCKSERGIEPTLEGISMAT